MQEGAATRLLTIGVKSLAHNDNACLHLSNSKTDGYARGSNLLVRTKQTQLQSEPSSHD